MSSLVCWLGFSRKIACLTFFLCGVLLVRSESQTLLGSWHFRGSQQVHRTEGGKVLKSVLQEDASQEVIERLIHKLASAPDKLFYGLDSSAHPERVKILQPLVEDLLAHESYGEVHGVSPSILNLNIAIRVGADRQIEWNKQLRKHAAQLGWEVNPSLKEGFTANWEAASQLPGFLMRYGQSGEWVVISVGSDVFNQWVAWRASMEKDAFPPQPLATQWLKLELQVSRLMAWLKPDTMQAIESVKLAWHGEGDHLRTSGALSLSSAMDESTEPWSIPLNRIVDPIISFTTQRNIAPLIGSLPGVSALFGGDIPSQSVAWAKPSRTQNRVVERNATPLYRNYITWPVEKGSESVQPHMERASQLMADSLLSSPSVRLVGNETLVTMQMTPPYIQPFLMGFEYGESSYQMAGLSKLLSNRTNPPPAALLGQIENHPRLRFYQWELTGEKIFEYRSLLNLLGALFQKGQMQQGPFFDWTEMLQNRLGNSVTQLLRKDAHTLEIQRKSHLGLTGLELALLARWMHAEAFPWIDADKLKNWELTQPSPQRP